LDLLGSETSYAGPLLCDLPLALLGNPSHG
jgi:hypothetical protein